MAKDREQWGSRIGFILAASGSAIGLGNIWRFPTAVGQNGGGAFVFMYLVLIFLIGIPVMMVELTLGRKTQRNVIGAFKELRPGTPWWIVGVMGVAAGFIILSFYSVIAGWSVAYIFKFLQARFLNLAPSAIEQEFVNLVTHPTIPLFWHGLFMAMTIGVVIAGVAKGIERWSKILMPMLLVLLVILAARSMTLEGGREGVFWLLRPDFARLDFITILGALGQVFFSLSLGMGAMLTYGSYLNRRENIPGSAVYIALADVAIAVLAGLIIIPAVFAFGLDPEIGPPLIFVTLPAVFQSMPLGNFFGALFFILLSIAALTSAISLLEVVVAYFIDELKWSRRLAAPMTGLAIFLIGIPSSLSNGILSDFTVFGMPLLDLKDAFTANILLPLGGLLMVIFVG
jgi:NSS family neurotransmitter:Na+ symporter